MVFGACVMQDGRLLGSKTLEVLKSDVTGEPNTATSSGAPRRGVEMKDGGMDMWMGGWRFLVTSLLTGVE